MTDEQAAGGGPIGPTIPDVDFNRVFKKVGTMPLGESGRLHLFHLRVNNRHFDRSPLEELLIDVVADYVYPRTKLEGAPGKGRASRGVEVRAVHLLERKGAEGELGGILLYMFLEKVLNAPKVFSKVEIGSSLTPFGTHSEGVHLLRVDDGRGAICFQTVFCASDITGDIADAIDMAFRTVALIKDETSEGIRLADDQTLRTSFSPEQARELADTLMPDPNGSVSNDTAYAVFIGYSLGLNPKWHTNAEYQKLIEPKMELDINAHAPMIAESIHGLGLDECSFYFFFLPFDDAKDNERRMMNYLYYGQEGGDGGLSDTSRTPGDVIFADIERNEYLNQLYGGILVNYANHYVRDVLGMEPSEADRPVNVRDALRFADLLSKSTAANAEEHRMWAQEIVVLLHELHPDDRAITYVAGSVFEHTDNTQGARLFHSDFDEPFLPARAAAAYRQDYLKIPASPDMHFFGAQKQAYDHLTDPFFSYSAPTSMGKSFLMRMFIKEQVTKGERLNFAIIVPTKALINETSQTIIQKDLNSLLESRNYRVVNAATDMALEGDHNFILVLTPERLLYLLISKPGIRIGYLFVDEAHKMSGRGDRSPFYYKTIDMLRNRKEPPHFIFASPNVPNPDVYLRLLMKPDDKRKSESIRTTFSPVTQMEFFLDLQKRTVSVYNKHSQEPEAIARIAGPGATFAGILADMEKRNRASSGRRAQQTIVYYNNKEKAVEAARRLAASLEEKHDADLDALSRDIAGEVHDDYYLAEVVRKGIAYHIGYLPAAIRMRVENLFRKGAITTIFCTSTLLEGVNLPADNLFVMSNRISRPMMTPVDFRNLVGRIGRIQYNLYGNVIFVTTTKEEEDSAPVPQSEYEKLLTADIPDQILSIEQKKTSALTTAEKKHMADSLIRGDTELSRQSGSQSDESYNRMRRFTLILLHDITTDNDSYVRRAFTDLIAPLDAAIIRNNYKDPAAQPDNDINISMDQTANLVADIVNGLDYPVLHDRHGEDDGGSNYRAVLGFLERLCRIFKWETYEHDTLGYTDQTGKHSRLTWYATLLEQWMLGMGLKGIMDSSIRYHLKPENRSKFHDRPGHVTLFDNSRRHRNILYSDTLEAIDNVILYSISNYFLRFSNEYKRIHGVTSFNNDWYEYVEYGTMNQATIFLQRVGFTHENAVYIREHASQYLTETGPTGIRLSRSLLECPNMEVREQAGTVLLNMPEAFEPAPDNAGSDGNNHDNGGNTETMNDRKESDDGQD